jgi:hypothetical protein
MGRWETSATICEGLELSLATVSAQEPQGYQDGNQVAHDNLI